MGHFVSSPREREKRARRDSRGDGRAGQGKRKMNESEGKEEIKTFFPHPPIYPYLLQGQQALPNCKPKSVGRPGDDRYTTPLPHPTTPDINPVSILHKSIEGRYRPVRVADGPITARYRFM